MRNPEIAPDFYLAAFEETRDWVPEITAKTGRIWTIAMYDRTVHTHLCEMTPSYLMYPCYFYTENHLEDNDEMEVRAAWESCRSEQPVFYVHTHDLKPLMHVGNIFVDLKGEATADPEVETEYEETIDAYISEMNCNGEPLWFDEDGQWHTSAGAVPPEGVKAA